MRGTLRRQPTARQSGFTIVETLVVLAAAGLILLVVLLAIPALQRNSHNNRRNQDVQAVLSAISQWQLNHSGNIPSSSNPYLQNAKIKLSYYEPENITVQGGSSGWAPAPNPVTDIDKVYVYNYQKCESAADATTPGKSTAKGAGYSDIVALYTIETRNSKASRCQQL